MPLSFIDSARLAPAIARAGAATARSSCASSAKIIVPAMAVSRTGVPNSGFSPESHGPTCSITFVRSDASAVISPRRSVLTQATAGM